MSLCLIYTSVRVFGCSVSRGQPGGNLFREMLIGMLSGVICRLRVENDKRCAKYAFAKKKKRLDDLNLLIMMEEKNVQHTTLNKTAIYFSFGGVGSCV